MMCSIWPRSSPCGFTTFSLSSVSAAMILGPGPSVFRCEEPMILSCLVVPVRVVSMINLLNSPKVTFQLFEINLQRLHHSMDDFYFDAGLRGANISNASSKDRHPTD